MLLFFLQSFRILLTTTTEGGNMGGYLIQRNVNEKNPIERFDDKLPEIILFNISLSETNNYFISWSSLNGFAVTNYPLF